MSVLKVIQNVAVVLAAAGIVFPIQNIQAAESGSAGNRQVAATVAADISKLQDGSFAGRIVDHEGAVIENAEVVVRQGNKVIARGKTNDQGMFAFKDLKSGTYQVSSGTTEGLFRVWSEQSAPPTAKKNALIVLGQKGARGQYGGIDEYPDYGWPGIDPFVILMTAGIVGALTIGIITLTQVNSLNSKVNNIPTSP